VQVTSPPAYSYNIPRNSVFDIQFNTPLDPSTVNSTNIYMVDTSTNLHVSGTYSMPQPNQVRIVPSSDLTANVYYYVYVTSGLHSSTSVPASSNSWYEYTWTADDTALPVIVSAVPYDGALNVGVNVAPGVVLSKPVDPASLNGNTFQVLNGATPLTGGFWISFRRHEGGVRAERAAAGQHQPYDFPERGPRQGWAPHHLHIQFPDRSGAGLHGAVCGLVQRHYW
jgi:hypothetical protein